MTKFVAISRSGQEGVDMDTLDLGLFHHATLESGSKMVFENAAYPGMKYIVRGKDFTFDKSTGLATGGTISKINIQSHNNYGIAIDDFSMSMADFSNFIASDNWTGMRAQLFQGNDTIIGTTASDVIDATDGGVDHVEAKGGSDVILVGGALTARDTIEGEYGFSHNATVDFDGDYSHGLTLNDTTITGVGQLLFEAGHSYKITSADATVGAYQTLTVNGLNLDSSDRLYFDGSAETDGKFIFDGGLGNDSFWGGAGADTFYMNALMNEGGNDRVNGGGGDDTIYFGGSFSSGDRIDGGAGNNTVQLAGNYSHPLTITQKMMQNIQTMILSQGSGYDNYDFILGGIPAGLPVTSATDLTINGSALKQNASMHINASARQSGSITLIGGKGNDVFRGGAGGFTYFDLTDGGNDKAYGLGGSNSF